MDRVDPKVMTLPVMEVHPNLLFRENFQLLWEQLLVQSHLGQLRLNRNPQVKTLQGLTLRPCQKSRS